MIAWHGSGPNFNLLFGPMNVKDRAFVIQTCLFIYLIFIMHSVHRFAVNLKQFMHQNAFKVKMAGLGYNYT